MSNEIGRRRALQIAGVGAVAMVTGGAGTWQWVVAPLFGSVRATSGQPLREPAEMASRNGILDVQLVAGTGIALAGRRTQALGFNGTSPGPTLRVAPGDLLRVSLTNNLEQTTNLHTHGLHVSPKDNSDNVFRMVEPGERASYEYRIPADHPTGTFWYHPHHHGTVADQVFGGLFGAVVVATPGESGAARERVVVISDITLAGTGEVAQASTQEVMAGREGELVLVNGQLRPQIDSTAGSTERWRVVNACVSRFLELQLDGHTLGFLGYDGQALGEPTERDTVVLAPGNRADLLVTPVATGDFTLRTLAYDRGGMGMMMGAGTASSSTETTLATVQVSAGSAPTATNASGLAAMRDVADLRGLAVNGQRTLTFTMGMGMGMGGGRMSFGFDGQQFDPARVDQRVALGTVEEWTIANASPMDHPFHLHVWPMQVVDAPDSYFAGPPDWRDVVIVPARGQVTVRIRFADFDGATVYHCHILDHEDQGMMGLIDAR